MARHQGTKNYFNFVGGHRTEVNPLTYPENSAQDILNMDLRRDGSLIRRRGIDYELGYSSLATIAHSAGYFATHVVSVHEWRSVGGLGSLNVLVTQIGASLYLTPLDAANIFTGTNYTIDNTAIGGGAADGSISLASVGVGAADTGLDKVQIAIGKGTAFICGPNIEPFFIEYHTSTGQFSSHYVGNAAGNIQVRDFAGLNDGLALDTRPAVANLLALQSTYPEHYYNLRNQGWLNAHMTTYITATGTAPSNSDIWWHGKDGTGAFTAAELNKIWFGAIQAPKGHFFYTAFNINRASVLAGLPVTTVTARPRAVGFYGGRVWYAGIGDAFYSGTLMYSRLIEDPAQDAHKCYMDADPSSEIVSDLVASDGGMITIPEAGEVVRLMAVADGLLVFAANGVWKISGTSSGGGFSATGYTVTKVSKVGTTSPEGIVEVEGTVFYISRSGIYMVSMDQSTLNPVATNITQDSIQSVITAISDAALPYVKAVYDPMEREVKWYYSTTLSANHIDRCDRVLVLDTVLKAWYPAQVSGTDAASGVPVLVAPFYSLPIAASGPSYESTIRHLVLYPSTTTSMVPYIGIFYDNRLVDWYTSNTAGYSYSSYVLTGVELFDDAMRDKQIDHMHIFLNRTETTVTNGVLDQPSSCLMSYRFDWADDQVYGKYSPVQQAYKYTRPYTVPSGVGTFPFNYGTNVIATKHNIRGAGRAVQVLFEAEGNNDMHILGWATFMSSTGR